MNTKPGRERTKNNTAKGTVQKPHPNEIKQSNSLQSLSVDTLLQFQKLYGNRAVGRMFTENVLPKNTPVAQLATRVDFEDANAVSPNEPKITGVNFGARPPARGGGGGGAQGDHTLAYTVIEWGAYNAVHDKTFYAAVYDLADLAKDLRKLPGFDMGHAADRNYRENLVQQLVDQAEAINGGTRIVSDINKSQVLGDLIDRYLTIRNDLHMTSRPHTAGANAHDQRGGQGLQTFAPTQPLVGGLLHQNDLNTVLGFIDDVFDYHNPTAQDSNPERAGLVALQALRSIFQAYPTQISSDWHNQITDAFEQRFVSNYAAAAQWNQRQKTSFNEALTTN